MELQTKRARRAIGRPVKSTIRRSFASGMASCLNVEMQNILSCFKYARVVILQCRQCLRLERRVVRWSAHDPMMLLRLCTTHRQRRTEEGRQSSTASAHSRRAGRGGTFEMVCVSSRRPLACIGLAENTFCQAVFVMLQSPCTHRVRELNIPYSVRGSFHALTSFRYPSFRARALTSTHMLS